MIPPRRMPPPYDLVTVNENLTGRVKMKDCEVKKKLVEELFVEVDVTYKKQYVSGYTRRPSHIEYVNKNIWRKAHEHEIDDLIINRKMIAI